MPLWFSELLARSNAFIPHGHCYLWIPSLLWLHVISDALIGTAYLVISLLLYVLVRTIRLPFSPVFVAFGLFIGLCGLTHFMKIWTVWNPDYWMEGFLKAATAAASVATAIGLVFVKPHIVELVRTARLSEERRIRLESSKAELEVLYDRLKEADQLKTQFFANISHELRTPLSLIYGPAERMLEQPDISYENRRQLETITRNSKALLRQVNDLLDVARLEEGKVETNVVRMDMGWWLRDIAGQFQVIAENRSIDYYITSPETLVTDTDPELMDRIVTNLLSNAFKFTPEGGAIHVALRGNPEHVELLVEDSGPGIDEQSRKLVFERFRQADGSITRKYGGTGLGLAIVKDYLELLGGTISVETSSKGGAAFLISIPRGSVDDSDTGQDVLRPETTLKAGDSRLEELGNMNIGSDIDVAPVPEHLPDVVLAEDNVEMREFIADSLRHRYKVRMTANGREALDAVLTLQPDLLITDIMMPEMSGAQLVEEVRSRNEFDAMPILLLSAKADDDLRVKLLRAGAQDYLPKPFLPQELRVRADNLVRLKRTGDLLRGELSSVSRDIEELAHELAGKHRQLQTALEAMGVAREQAEKASLVKSHFLALISHEMRTPLSTILMNAELLDRDPAVKGSPSTSTKVQRVVRGTRHLTSLIEGLLEYSRIESGRMTAQLATTDIVELAREAVHFAQAEINEKEVQLELEAPPSGIPEVVTDPKLLRVVISNLLSNAIKFTERGMVKMDLQMQQEQVLIAISDTGPGIPAADLGRIFLPFEQLEPIQRKSIPGVGLGLALVKELLTVLQGTVKVQSEEGKGTTFTVTLPLAPALSAEQKADQNADQAEKV